MNKMDIVGYERRVDAYCDQVEKNSVKIVGTCFFVILLASLMGLIAHGASATDCSIVLGGTLMTTFGFAILMNVLSGRNICVKIAKLIIAVALMHIGTLMAHSITNANIVCSANTIYSLVGVVSGLILGLLFNGFGGKRRERKECLARLEANFNAKPQQVSSIAQPQKVSSVSI